VANAAAVGRRAVGAARARASAHSRSHASPLRVLLLQYHPEYDLHELARLTHCRIKKLVG
jgi:hypothetical protein